MDLTAYVDALHFQLVVAAQAGGEEARELAERLVAPLDTATRLVLLEALSAAADEITSDLAPGSVELRLRSGDPEFVVTPPPAEPSFEDQPAEMAEAVLTPADADEGGTSRITLRLPDHLKPHIDEAAGRSGLSVNAWLVRVVSSALQSDQRTAGPDRRRVTPLGKSYSGWVR